MSLPQWTSRFTDDTVPGEDHLGIEGAAQGYQQYLIPGIITTTDHARYYSFYAWVLYRFIYDENSSRLLADFRGPYFRRHEVAFILGCYSHHKDTGVITGLVGGGTNNSKARRMWESSDPSPLDVDYFNNKLGGFGQYYRTAMQAMGLVADAERPRWVYRLTNRGRALAEAFETSIRDTAYFSALKKQGQLTSLAHEAALEYGSRGCLCSRVLSTSVDRSLLWDAFFRFDRSTDVRDPHARRRLTLGLILDLTAKSGKIPLQQSMRPALYLGEYAAGHRYEPADALSEWYTRWRLVQVRHTYTSAIQLLWAAFLGRLWDVQDRGMTFSEFMDWVNAQLPSDQASVRVSEYLNQLCAATGLKGRWDRDYPLFDVTRKLGDRTDEYAMYIDALEERGSPSVLIGSAVCILSQFFLRFHGLHQSADSTWLEMARRPRLPIAQFFSDMRYQLGMPDWTVRRFLEWLYREYILGQHESIALEKLRYQQYDTFKFYYQDDVFRWPYGSKYSEPLRYPALRLENGLSILIDLGLVEEDQDGVCRLTDDGQRHLTCVLEAAGGN